MATKKKFSAIVIDADTGEVLFDHNSGHIGHPASITKIFTLKMVFDALNSGKTKLSDMIPISKHAARQQPTKFNLAPNSRISVMDAILALITHSANDVAAAVAEFIGTSEPHFARLMTQKAHSIGMKDTVFKNASGLPHPEQVTTARDMAILARHLVDDYDAYLQYFATTSFYYKGRNYRNHNKLLGSVEGVDCCKTGFTNASGWNLVASAKRGDKRVIAVILGGPTRYYRDMQMTRLINNTFKKLDLLAPTQVSASDERDDIGIMLDELAKSSPKMDKKPLPSKRSFKKGIKKKRV
jgi:D-alanyl-D-alanine carboxypeptidase